MERLGFNGTMVMVLVGALGLVLVGNLLGSIAGYEDLADDDSRDKVRNLEATQDLLAGIGVVVIGALLFIAAVRAEGHSTAIRAVLIIVAVLLLFDVVDWGFSVNG